MDVAATADGADRFMAYVEALTSVIGHADRALPLRDYCAGLLTAEGRKSVEPMAAVTAPARVSVQHQKLFDHPGYDRMSITQAGDELQWTYRGMSAPLVHRHYDTFELPEATRAPVARPACHLILH